jgi:hypothetical protein
MRHRIGKQRSTSAAAGQIAHHANYDQSARLGRGSNVKAADVDSIGHDFQQTIRQPTANDRRAGWGIGHEF